MNGLNGKPVSYTHLDVYKRQVVPFLPSLRQSIFKLNICRFIAAPKGGHKRFPVCLIRVLDIIKGCLLYTSRCV